MNFEVACVIHCKRKVKIRNKRKFIIYENVLFSKEFKEFCENSPALNFYVDFKESLKR